MNDLLNINNLSFSYNEKNNIFSSFKYKHKIGENLSILGNSGCGKTTLLNLITGLLKPQKGTITTTNNAFLTQDITLFSYRTAIENSLFACELRNNLDEEKIKEANKLFQQFNLPENSKKKFPQELSGGMQQRVALIQTLLIDAELYLLDEPFNAIERTTSLTIQELIWNRFKSNKSSLIIITHDIEQAVLMSDKILILSTNNKHRETNFNDDFVKLTPKERLNSEYYDEYMLDIIKKLSES